MRLNEIIQLTNARIVAGHNMDVGEISVAYSSDLMSDVLTLDTDQLLLISGLANVQLIRTAEIADVAAVLLARGKKTSPEMIDMADKIGLVILESPFSLFRASGVLFAHGLYPIY
ncbi:MAG: hypothetical protein GX087_11475 [Desulfobulbaceae bacterium]|nr:hypothetical protein [Desulfobulbaceae bacterium]